jgi:hypothetical protein
VTTPINGLFVEAGVETRGLTTGVDELIAQVERFGQTVDRVAQTSQLTVRTETVERDLNSAVALLQRFNTYARDLAARGLPIPEPDLRRFAAEFQAAGGDVNLFFNSLHEGVERQIADLARLSEAAHRATLIPQPPPPPPPGPPPPPPGRGTSDPQQLRILAAMLEEEEQLTRAQTEAADAAGRHSAAETSLTAALVQQELAAVRAGGASRYQAEQSLLAGQAAANAARLTSAAAAANEAAASATRVASTAVGGMIDRMSELGRQRLPDALITGMSRAGIAAREARGGIVAVSDAAEGGARGFGRLERALGAAAFATAGLEGPATRVVDALLPLALGGEVLLPLLGGFALLAAGYDLITAGARKAEEQQNKLLDALRQRVAAAPPPTPIPGGDQTALQQDAALQRQVAAAEQRRAQLQQELNRVQQAGTPVQVEDVRRQFEAAGQELTAGLNELARVRTDFERQQSAQLNAVGLAGVQQRIQDQNALEQRGLQLREAMLRTSLEQGAITEQQFADRHAALIRRAAQADIAALTEQREKLLAAPPPASTAGQADLFNRVTALDRAVELRRAELAITLQQADAERQVAAARQTESIRAFAQQTLQTTANQIQVPIALKPEIPTTELVAAVNRVTAAFEQGRWDDMIQDAIDKGEELAILLEGLTGKVADIGNANIGRVFDGVRGGAAIQAAQDINAVGSAFVDAARQSNLFSADTISALEKIQQAASDAAGLVAGIASGNPVLAITSGIHLVGDIGGLFGKSDAERRREAVERQNLEQLGRIARELGNVHFDISGDLIGGLQSAFATITDPSQFLLENNTRLGTRVDEFLNRFGLDLDDVRRIAQELGLTFSNSAEFYQLFADRILPEAAAAVTQFGDSLDEQTRRANLGSRLRDEAQNPVAVFQRNLQVIEGFSPAVQRAFANIDTSSREAVRAALLRLFEQFDAGQLTAADLGLTKEQFLQFLEDGANFLDSFNDKLQDATRTLGNVPDDFKVAQAEFFARRFEPLPGTTPPEPPSRFPTATKEPGGVTIPANPPPAAAPVPVTIAADDDLPTAIRELPAAMQAALDRVVRPDPIVTARPVTDALATLSGGASLRDLVTALRGGAPAAATTGAPTAGNLPAGTALGGRPVLHVFVASVNIPVSGQGDPEATAKYVRERFDRQIDLSIPRDDN